MQSDRGAQKCTEGACTPFIVYAVDSPTYPERLFGCCDAGPFVAKPYTLSGSAIVVSGGCSAPDHLMGDQLPRVMQVGLRRELGSVGLRFGEAVVSALVEPRERVTIYYWKRASRVPDWPKMARAVGFEVRETEDYAVCTGRGSMLGGLPWLEGGGGYAGTGIIASRQSPSLLEIALLESACGKGYDVGEVLDGFWRRVLSNPETIPNELAGFSLFAGLGVPDFEVLGINRRQTADSELHRILCDVASGLGIVLYDANSVSEVDASGHSFGEFWCWYEWRPLPPGWRRVA